MSCESDKRLNTLCKK